jgi:exopolysaccharide production protein ExoZ
MLHGIQAFRAIAALLVVIFHSAANLAKEKYFGQSAKYLDEIFSFGGQAGVAFFFVLSGFIIHHVHAKDFDRPDKLWSYIRKRIIRIYPTYIIIFLTVFFAAYATPSLRESMPNSVALVVKSLMLLPQDIAVVGGTGAPVIVVAWSLQYEMFFYTLFGLALINRKLFYLASAFTAALIINFSETPAEFPVSFFSNHLIILFGMGVVSSAAINMRIPVNMTVWVAWGAALGFTTVAICASRFYGESVPSYIDLSYGICSALLIHSVTQHEQDNGSPLIFKKIGRLGDSSYSLYLLHFPLIAILSKIAIMIFEKTNLGALVSLCALVLLSVVAALIFNILIEKTIFIRLNRSV